MDRHTPEQRRKNMQAIKNKDSNIELLLRKELWNRGLRYRKNVKKVFGHPDIAFIEKKIAVFCDSEFWHGYDWENRQNEIKSHREFWIPKIERNMQRDVEVTEALEHDGCLCANCHRMIHRKQGSIMTIEELRKIMDEHRAGNKT